MDLASSSPQPTVPTRSLGPASLSFPFVGAALVGDTLVVVSRNLTPTRVALYDLPTASIIGEVTIPDGLGAWGITPSGDEGVYLGQFGAHQAAANLWHLHLPSRNLTALAGLPHVYVWDLTTTPDGLLAGVLGQPGGAFTHDPTTGRTTILPPGAAAPAETPRAITASVTELIIGGSTGGRAFLRAHDPATGTTRDILPAQLADHGIVYTLASNSSGPRAQPPDLLAVGTRGPGEANPAIAVLDARDPLDLRSIATLQGESVVDALAVTPDIVLGTSRPSGALHRLDLRTDTLERLAQPVPLDEMRGVFPREGEVVGTAASGAVWRLLPDGSVTVVDPVSEGLLEGGPERAQSLAAADGRVWVGGTFGVSEIDVDSGERRRRAVPGEPKDIAVGPPGSDRGPRTLHLGVYPVGQVWELDGDLRMVAQLPPEENRPLAVHRADDVVLVGTAADRAGGGGLHILDPSSGALRSHRNPIDGRQRVASIAALDGIAYLGGTVEGTIVAWDLDADREVWRPPPIPEGGTVRGLAVLDGRVHAFTTEGWLVTIDPGARAVVSSARVAAAGGGLATAGGELYGVDHQHLYRLDPVAASAAVVLDGLDSQLWGSPFLAADEEGRLYVIRGTDVLQVSPQG